ncbi:MAG: histidine kinase dimerization/phospho-acceptor domain-containing protein [Desulfobacterales bacterium]|nr:histidine kinase dimerization/phospho-acceptor domain-containing protein [Desulfobacterales bacterium]
MDDKRIPAELDFKGLRHSKIGYFKEVRTKIKELEKLNLQLAKRHNRLNAIFNSMSDGVTILDRNLAVVFTNQVQREMFPDISDTARHCHQVFYQRDTRCPDCPALKTMETGQMMRGEHMFKKGRQANRFYEWTTSPIAGARGQVEEVILIMRDITERKEFEFRSMQTDRMVSVGFLATSLAHEINNPLTSIAGFSEGLLKRLKRRDVADDGRLLASFREYLEIINSEAYRCKDIIQNLREFSKNASDEYETLPIDVIIAETIALVRQHAMDHRIQITYQNHLSAGFNGIIGKSSQLKHLFLNLFKQLFSAMAAGGELAVIARNDGENIEVLLPDPNGRLSGDFSGCLTYPALDGAALQGRERMDLSLCYNIIRHHKGDVQTLSGGDGSQQLVLRFPVALP